MGGVLKAFTLFEKLACGFGFALITVALIADVLSRMILGAGVLGAPQVGVIGMIILAMFGMGVASGGGAHYRLSFIDQVTPDALKLGARRIGDFVTALFFLALGVISIAVAHESFLLEDYVVTLGWPVWTLQAIFPVAFLMNAIRFFIYGARPDLSPESPEAQL